MIVNAVLLTADGGCVLRARSTGRVLTTNAVEFAKQKGNVLVAAMTKFVQMIEHNEHEGESWCYWLLLDGNEKAIDDLIGMVEEDDLEDEYEFTGITADYWEVCVLEAKGNFGYGYGNQHSKIEGVLTLPPEFQVNDIYKGKIEDFFH